MPKTINRLWSLRLINSKLIRVTFNKIFGLINDYILIGRTRDMNLIEQLDLLVETHLHSRLFFPYIDPKWAGSTSINVESPLLQGKIMSISYDDPLTKDLIIKNNKMAHYHNQNFVIRLFAILEDYLDLYGKEEKELEGDIPGGDGFIAIMLIRNLRNSFVHPDLPKNEGRKRRDRIIKDIEQLCSTQGLANGDFNLDYGNVLIPLANIIRTYITDYNLS